MKERYSDIPTAIEPITDSNPISAEALATLHEMDNAALVSLVERMARQCGLVALMTREETAQAMLDALAHTALKPIVVGLSMKADIDNRLKAIDRWLDRVEGKAIQRIDQRIANIHTTAPGELSTAELMQLLKQEGVPLLENGMVNVTEAETT